MKLGGARPFARPHFHEGLTMAETTTSADGSRADIETVREDYLQMTQRRRLYSGLLILIFAVLMISGFNTADGRNAGGFWDGCIVWAISLLI
jgi:hypothetical protein